MVLAAILVFLLAAVFGLFILARVLQNKPTPKPAVIIHGPIAAVGLVLVIIDIVKGHTEGLLISALIIFIVAAIGGFTMYVLDTLGKRIPKPLAIIHPLVALAALIVLIIYAIQ